MTAAGYMESTALAFRLELLAPASVASCVCMRSSARVAFMGAF